MPPPPWSPPRAESQADFGLALGGGVAFVLSLPILDLAEYGVLGRPTSEHQLPDFFKHLFKSKLSSVDFRLDRILGGLEQLADIMATDSINLQFRQYLNSTSQLHDNY